MIISKEIFLRQLFDEFESKQLDYFVIGEYQLLPEDTGGSDIDILASDTNATQIAKVLCEIAVKNDVKVASHYKNAHTEMFRFITFGWGVQIDVLRGFFYKGIEYYPTSNVKTHILRHKGITVVDEQFGFYVDFFKEMIYNGHAKEKYCNALLQVMCTDEKRVQVDVETCYSVDTWQLISQNRTIIQLNRVGRQIRRSMKNSLCSIKLLYSEIIYFFMRLGRFFQPTPGYVIAVEGTDGSGKSAIINSVTPWLNECFHNSVIYNHLRPHLMPDIGVLLGKRTNDSQVTIVDNPHVQKPSGFMGSIVRWIYYLHDYTWGYLLKVWPKIRTRSYVFVFDRYYYDYFIDNIRSRTILPHWLLRTGEIFVPKPDIILCLGGDPEKIYARKSETSLEEVTRQTEELKRFAAKRKNAVWIDTTQPIENSIHDAKTAILTMMSKRFKNVL